MTTTVKRSCCAKCDVALKIGEQIYMLCDACKQKIMYPGYRLALRRGAETQAYEESVDHQRGEELDS